MIGNTDGYFKTTSARVSKTISSGPDVKNIPSAGGVRKGNALPISSPLKGNAGCASCRKRRGR